MHYWCMTFSAVEQLEPWRGGARSSFFIIFYKFSPSGLNGRISEARTHAKRCLLRPIPNLSEPARNRVKGPLPERVPFSFLNISRFRPLYFGMVSFFSFCSFSMGFSAGLRVPHNGTYRASIAAPGALWLLCSLMFSKGAHLTASGFPWFPSKPSWTLGLKYNAV